ncbi:hypothetical protein [Roseibium aggregatum]|uniref:Uncharacterized protein n=1 Tax=Roseibium aggregatum TaxID=187304 RepID=A0A926P0B2_9HYPH|nr:hypothetical protein [Roseibium aggregatum]MBD1547591.1 hypothetical protein [Roseibium aggregatum]
MTQAELIAALPDGRLPPDLMTLGPSDLLLAFGVGLIVSALLSMLLAPFVRRRPSRKALIRATRGLPPEERLLAIAKIVGRLPEELRPAAYRRAALPDDRTVERIALKARPKRK